MNLKTFFSEQARKPSGLFGRFVMPRIFDLGNIVLNDLMKDSLAAKENDHVLEIGFGTGKFISEIAKTIGTGSIEGIDLSKTMMEIAIRKNQQNIAQGRVILKHGDFDTADYDNDSFDVICSANTIYFWPNEDSSVNKIFRILKPGGKLVLAFEDIDQLRSRHLNTTIFNFFSVEKIKKLLIGNGFSNGVDIFTREVKSQKYHCAVSIKDKI